MFRRILVPLDGSLRAELILEYLLPLLKDRKPELILARAVAEPGRGEPADTLLPSAEAYLARIQEGLAQDGVRAGTRIVLGPPAAALLESARREGADVIALTTHGRSGLDRLVMGSVAESILRKSEIPVLAIRSFSPRIFSGRANPFRKILLPVEEGKLAASVLPTVGSFARAFGSEVLVVHVAAGAPLAAGAFFGSIAAREFAPPPVEAEEAPVPSDAIDRVSADLARAGLGVRTLTVRGDVSSKIVELALSQAADVILMATHGRSGFLRWVKGSVTEEVLRASPIPLLAFRPVP